jgi:arabinose-5-phosphate isomerase
MKDVFVEITEKSFGCVCVVNKDNKIVGVITDGYLIRKLTVNFLEMKACETMTKKS